MVLSMRQVYVCLVLFIGLCLFRPISYHKIIVKVFTFFLGLVPKEVFLFQNSFLGIHQNEMFISF